jgi:hypothetical protein
MGRDTAVGDRFETELPWGSNVGGAEGSGALISLFSPPRRSNRTSLPPDESEDPNPAVNEPKHQSQGLYSLYRLLPGAFGKEAAICLRDP